MIHIHLLPNINPLHLCCHHKSTLTEMQTQHFLLGVSARLALLVRCVNIIWTNVNHRHAFMVYVLIRKMALDASVNQVWILFWLKLNSFIFCDETFCAHKIKWYEMIFLRGNLILWYIQITLWSMRNGIADDNEVFFC